MTALAVLILVQAVPSAPLAQAHIWFDARATVADFQGRATAATGALLSGASPAEARGWVEVRWRDIDTKNRTRNRHMLETVAEQDHPVIRFDLTEVLPEDTTGDTLRVRLEGTLALHGASRPVEWPAAVRVALDTVTVAADFPVDMRDYGIKPPVRFVIARMGAVVNVHVRLVFVKNQTRG